MNNKYDFSNFYIQDENFNESVTNFKKINEANPFKKYIYNDMKNFDNYLYEEYVDSSPLFRIIKPNSVVGTIEIPILSKMLNGIQDTFTSAYQSFNGFHKKNSTVIRNTTLSLLEAAPGSFIIKIDTTDKLSEKVQPKKNEQLDLIHNSINQTELLDDLILSLSEIDTNEAVIKFIRKYGVSATNHTKKWFESLDKEDVSFEYKHVTNEIESNFTSNKINTVYNLLKNNILEEIVDTVEFIGTLIGINNKSKTLTFSLLNDSDITVKVEDNSLNDYKLTTNVDYQLKVTKTEKITFNEVVITYSLNTINNTNLIK